MTFRVLPTSSAAADFEGQVRGLLLFLFPPWTSLFLSVSSLFISVSLWLPLPLLLLSFEFGLSDWAKPLQRTPNSLTNSLPGSVIEK